MTLSAKQKALKYQIKIVRVSKNTKLYECVVYVVCRHGEW